VHPFARAVEDDGMDLTIVLILLMVLTMAMAMECRKRLYLVSPLRNARTGRS
jgi:hypothetical protein